MKLKTKRKVFSIAGLASFALAFTLLAGAKPIKVNNAAGLQSNSANDIKNAKVTFPTIKPVLKDAYSTFANDLNECAPSKTMGDLRGQDQGRVISNASGGGDSTNNSSTIAKVSNNNYSQHVRVNYYNSGVHNVNNVYSGVDARYVLRSNSNCSQGYGFTFKNTSDLKANVGIEVNNVNKATFEVDLEVKVVHLVEMYAVNSKDNTKVYCYIYIDNNYIGSYTSNEVINNERATHQLNGTANGDEHGQHFIGFGSYYENCEDLGQIKFNGIAADFGNPTSMNFFIEAESTNNLPITEGNTFKSEEVNVYPDADANFKLNGTPIALRYVRSGGSLSKINDKIYKVCIDKFGLSGNDKISGCKATVDENDVLEISGSYNFSDIGGSHKTYTFSVARISFIYRGNGVWEHYKTLNELVEDAKADLSAYKASDILDLSLDLTSEFALAELGLNQVASKEEITPIVDAYKDAVDAKVTAASLVITKSNSKIELTEYVDLNDYRDAEKASIQALVSQGCASIDNATTESGVINIVNYIKSQIDAIKTDAQLIAEAALNDAKTSAKSTLDSYANPNDYDDEGKQALSKAVEDGKKAIDIAESSEQVNTALSNAKSAIDAIAKKAAKGNGCGGSIAATSALISLVSILGITFISYKRKK